MVGITMKLHIKVKRLTEFNLNLPTKNIMHHETHLTTVNDTTKAKPASYTSQVSNSFHCVNIHLVFCSGSSAGLAIVGVFSVTNSFICGCACKHSKYNLCTKFATNV